MAGRINRGEIWMYTFGSPDKRRPVVVLSRQALLEVTESALVVAITGTIRGVPTEVELGVEDGLKKPSVANLVSVHTVPQHKLSRYVGAVRPERLRAICNALAIAAGCR